MYMYVQPGCKKVNTAMYIHTGGVSNAYLRIRTARAHVHGEAATASCSSGANRLGRNSRSKLGLAYRKTEETAFCSTGHGRNGIMFIGRAWTERAMEIRSGVPQNGGNGLVLDRPHLKRDPVHREGSGILQNGGNRLVLEH